MKKVRIYPNLSSAHRYGLASVGRGALDAPSSPLYASVGAVIMPGTCASPLGQAHTEKPPPRDDCPTGVYEQPRCRPRAEASSVFERIPQACRHHPRGSSPYIYAPQLFWCGAVDSAGERIYNITVFLTPYRPEAAIVYSTGPI